MVNPVLRLSWLVGGWLAAVAIIVAASIAMGANRSTTALVLALAIAPGIVMALLAHGLPSASVVQILHAVETKDGRS